MNDFTASNGIPVKVTNDGRLIVENADHTYPATIAAGDHVEALREFFQAERDEALGRWRWPEDPDITVRIAPDHAQHGSQRDTVLIQSDKSGYVGYYNRERLPEITEITGGIVKAGHAYFDAHPDPKPWDDAEHGEIWLLTGAGGLVQPWRREHGEWISVTSRRIKRGNVDLVTAGRRIWPEVS